MAFDYFAVTSYGVYPTPTPTLVRRAGLAVSMGLLNFALPLPVPPVVTPLTIIKSIIKSIISPLIT